MSEGFEIVMAILFAIALYVAIVCVNCFHTVRKGNASIKKGTIKKFIDDYWFKGFYDDLVRANIIYCLLNLINLIYVLCTNSESVDQSSDLFYNVDINHKIDWSVFMGWAEVITLTVGILGVIGAIVGVILSDRKLFRKMEDKIGSLNNTTLSGEHDKIINVLSGKMGSLDNTTLSGEHQNIIKELSNKIGVLDNTTLSGQNNNIKRAVDELTKKLKTKSKSKLLTVNA